MFHPINHDACRASNLSRRELLQRTSNGFGAMALSSALGTSSYAESSDKQPTAKAKHVVFCYMSGGVSHVDSFDPKPKLAELHGQPMPVEVERTQFNNNGNIMKSPFKFIRQGQSGIPISEIFPKIGQYADEMAVIRSMTSTVNEHAQGNFLMHSGFPIMGYPTAGVGAAMVWAQLMRTCPAMSCCKAVLPSHPMVECLFTATAFCQRSIRVQS